MSMITEQVKRLRNEADGYMGYRSKRAIRVKHLLREAADTIEAYQKAFEDIWETVKRTRPKFCPNDSFLGGYFDAKRDILEIIDKHDPAKEQK